MQAPEKFVFPVFWAPFAIGSCPGAVIGVAEVVVVVFFFFFFGGGVCWWRFEEVVCNVLGVLRIEE